METFVAAAIQLCARQDRRAAVANALELVRAAEGDGAQLIVLPENYGGFGTPADRVAAAFDPDDAVAGPTVAALAEFSAGSAAWIVAGGTPERAADGRTFNTALVLHRGHAVARYRKEHLFDAHLPTQAADDLAGGLRLQESLQTVAGESGQNVVVDMGFARVGLSICFDLRFGAHYRRLRECGAEVIVVPSAFTRPTGGAHWEVLLRARAIETQTFVVAPGQWGDHGGNRSSWGHSMLIDPWGTVLAHVEDGDAVVRSELQSEALEMARRRIPIFGAE